MQGRERGQTDFSNAAIGLMSGGLLALAGFLLGKAERGTAAGDPVERSWDSGKAKPTGQETAKASSAGDKGRGRDAERPSAIPAKGWKDVLWRTFEEFSNDRLMLVAAGVTFYVLLALFPAITALISIYGLFTDPASLRAQLDALSGILPSGAVSIIGEQLQRVTSQSDGKLGFGMVFGLGLALWSANAGMKTLFDAMNIVYEEEEKRSFIRLTLVTLAMTLSMIVFLLVALGAVVVLPIALDYIGLGGLETWLLLLRWPVLLLVVALGLTAIYRIGPSRQPAKWRWITWGSAFAAVLWIVFSGLFSWYVQNFGNYDQTYGSLGAAIGFMTWIWISTIVVLLGAEVNAELEHQTAEDTTTRPARPMGSRGAQMADTLGDTKG
ncbi:YihY/virulence factor BrkB family protein [Aureimonas psammosilenae]|uniref:YihY/virulence factor BrkB family protein n=1 Tax=Aureimonas psammosilenae TaxID=2495496 RepID=UPI0012608F98|nr:YihY/virulence factor BrkB family protein [Aureimonas psammosilenae]